MSTLKKAEESNLASRTVQAGIPPVKLGLGCRVRRHLLVTQGLLPLPHALSTLPPPPRAVHGGRLRKLCGALMQLTFPMPGHALTIPQHRPHASQIFK